MECEIPSRHLKLFAKSISCMDKIGKELFIEATQHQLVLRTINEGRNAFIAFYLDERFFDGYVLEDNIERKYQVKLKPCHSVFKQHANVEKCIMRLDEIEQRLVFELYCKHGIRKKFTLTFEECDAVQAVYSKDQINRLVVIPKKLVDSLNNFHTQIEEVSLIVNKDSLKFKSHADDIKSAIKVLQTEMIMEITDFEEFSVEEEAFITFSLKEFKAMLNFCDTSGQPVSLLFERGGRPILLSTKYFNVFEADFVLATLIENASQSTTTTPSASSSQNSSLLSPTSNSSSNVKKRKYESTSPASNSSTSHISHSPSQQLDASPTKKAKIIPHNPSPTVIPTSDPMEGEEEYELRTEGIRMILNSTGSVEHNNLEDEEVACSQDDEEN